MLKSLHVHVSTINGQRCVCGYAMYIVCVLYMYMYVCAFASTAFCFALPLQFLPVSPPQDTPLPLRFPTLPLLHPHTTTTPPSHPPQTLLIAPPSQTPSENPKHPPLHPSTAERGEVPGPTGYRPLFQMTTSRVSPILLPEQDQEQEHPRVRV